MQPSKRRVMQLVTAVLVPALFLVLGGYRPAEARRSNIVGTSGVLTVFNKQAINTTDVTSTVTVPTGQTEGGAFLIDVQGLTGSNTVYVNRLERVGSGESNYGYPVPSTVNSPLVLSGTPALGPHVYLIPYLEGIEYFTFNVSTTQASGVTITILGSVQ